MRQHVVMPEYQRTRECRVCGAEFIAHAPIQVRCIPCQDARTAAKQKVNFARAKARRQQERAEYRREHPGLTPAQIVARTSPRIRINL